MKRFFLISLFCLSSCLAFAVDYAIEGLAPGKLSTAAIQAAIDKCSAEGGGRVILPRGEWISGTVELKDGVTLYLEKGAVLKGSTDKADYTKYFIRAQKANHIGIEGEGTVDGSGYAFWKVDDKGYYDHDRPVPGYMCYFEGCHDLRVRNVRLTNAESWTLHLLGCQDVQVRDVTIRNPLHGPNNDGIDIQACKNVTISGCDIYTSDDGIVLKNRHPSYNFIPCANITVTNCIVTTVCNALKIGTETLGAFRNITFSNCTVRQAQPSDEWASVRAKEQKKPLRAISGISIESADGSDINGVTFNNIVMEDVRCPIFIRLNNRGAGVQKNNPPQPGRIRNVVISNVTARNAWFASSITAIPGSYVENVILENIIVTMKGINNPALVEKTVDEKINAYPDAHMWGDLPASTFYVRHAKNLSLGNVKCFLDAEDIRPLCIFDDVKDLQISGFISDEQHTGNAAFRFIGVENAFFTSVFLKGSPKFWYDLRGEGNTNIHLSDTEPTKVRSEKSCSVVQQTSFILL